MRKGRFAGFGAAAAERRGRGLLGLLGPRPDDPPDPPADAGTERAAGLVAAFEQSGCGWFWETNADGQLSYVSDSLARALGREGEALAGRRFAELLLVEEANEAERPALGFHLSRRFPFADLVVAPNGRREPVWSLSGRPRFDPVGRFLGFRGVAVGLGEGQRAEIRTGRLATRDSLTGLSNRARMRAMLDEALANADSRREGCGLMLIDLDRFKQVNDTLGHPIGDLLLKEVAQRLVAAIGDEGRVGRLGGDEFEALLPGTDEEGALAALAGRTIATLSAPYVVRGHRIEIGASVGIAISRPGKTLADALVKEADLALYAAKRAGRGTHRFFEPEMHAQESERAILESDLKAAIAGGQLRLAFQPVVRAKSEELVGFEALARWMHPVRGALAPADFLPLAEASGLMAGIGDWIVRAACAEAARWPEHLVLAVNLSPAELDHPPLAATVAGALAAAGLDPARLELDVGEAALLADAAAPRSVLAALKGLGVRLALDDFGLAPASLLSLRSAALDRVKLHPSLLRGALAEGSRAEAAVAAVVGLAHRLGMAVTAEGAETAEALDLVRRLGCDDVQGFLFGRPMAADEAARLAAASRPAGDGEAVRPRPPRHSLIRRGTLRRDEEVLPVRLRNISAGGAMIECDVALDPGEAVELVLAEGVRLAGEVSWCRDGRVGLAFAAPFDVHRLGKARRRRGGEALVPDYLRSELQPDSPWASRRERLSRRDVEG